MQFSVSIDSVARVLVEGMLPRHSGEAKVLTMTFSLHVRGNNRRLDWGHRFVHLVFQRRGNYTKVLMHADHDQARYTGTWEMVSNHDSCWADGLEAALARLGHELAQEAGTVADKSDTLMFFAPTGHPKIEEIKGLKELASRRYLVEWAD